MTGCFSSCSKIQRVFKHQPNTHQPPAEQTPPITHHSPATAGGGTTCSASSFSSSGPLASFPLLSSFRVSELLFTSPPSSVERLSSDESPSSSSVFLLAGQVETVRFFLGGCCLSKDRGWLSSGSSESPAGGAAVVGVPKSRSFCWARLSSESTDARDRAVHLLLGRMHCGVFLFTFCFLPEAASAPPLALPPFPPPPPPATSFLPLLDLVFGMEGRKCDNKSERGQKAWRESCARTQQLLEKFPHAHEEKSAAMTAAFGNSLGVERGLIFLLQHARM